MGKKNYYKQAISKNTAEVVLFISDKIDFKFDKVKRNNQAQTGVA